MDSHNAEYIRCCFQMFLRDAKQAEVLLSQQDNFLSKEEVPVSHMTKAGQSLSTTDHAILGCLIAGHELYRQSCLVCQV